MTSRVVGVFLLALMIAGTTTPALAIWPFSRAETTETVPDPVRYTLDIQVVGGNRSLDRALRNASSLYSRRRTPTSGLVGLLARSREDIGALTGVLYQHARYAGEVTVLIEGRPTQSWSPFDPVGPQPVPVVIEVVVGAQFLFGRVDAGPLPPGVTLQDLDIAPGELAESGRVVDAEDRIVGGWRMAGHPLASAGETEIVADHATRTLDVSIWVDPGPVADFGRVDVVGGEGVNHNLIIGRAGIRPGELYSPKATRKAEERLRDLGVFESVRVVPGEQLDPDGTIPVEIIVSERKRRVVGAGVNYSNTEGAGIEVFWAHRNLWGGAESLRLSAQVSNLFDDDFDEPDFRVAGRFRKPGVFDPMTDFTLRTEAFRETTDAYRVTTAEAEAGLTRAFTDTVSGEAHVEIERTRTEDAIPEEDYLTTTLTGAIDWDRRDNRLDPSRGFHLHVEAAPAYEFLHGKPFATFSKDFAIYRAVDSERRFVLAGRVAAATLTVDNVRDVPANRRLYAGGAGSVRGYGYQNIGPRNKKGDHIGGRSNFAVSGEVRYRVSEALGLVAFVDAGNAYRDMIPDIGDLKVGVGGGIRYVTPVGPLRVDLAFPLDPGRDDPSFALYVGLGQAF
ncbi:MAG: outer membrane protein assembly factor [Hyphomicrobiales bacterium]|nr:outer membrane protein assembly factor [Hyphomicrobiales bacterium]